MLKNVGLSNHIQYISTQTNIPSLYNLPGQNSIKFLGGILENFQTSKGHSEINWPLGASSDLEFYVGTTTSKPQTTTKKTVTTTKKPVPTTCAFPKYATDQYCDDLNNTPECYYDGGACCGQTVDRLFCESCECLDPDVFEDGCGVASLGW